LAKGGRGVLIANICSEFGWARRETSTKSSKAIARFLRKAFFREEIHALPDRNRHFGLSAEFVPSLGDG
jgi:hypothetical protein